MMSMGAILFTQKCHNTLAPTSFYGAHIGTHLCQRGGAPKGRVIPSMQKCHCDYAPPNQSQGAIRVAQKCQGHGAPKLITWCHAGAAEMPALWRTIGESQKQNTEMPWYRCFPQPITGGYLYSAEMPDPIRPYRIWAIQVAQQCLADLAQITTTRGQPSIAQ